MSSDVTNNNNALPFVSVIMPVRNEGIFIERSLKAVLDQTYPANLMEVVIADGMSTDDTRERIKRLAGSGQSVVKIVDNEKRIAPSGLNRALEQAKGEIVIRVDGHCEIDAAYVENCVALLLAGKADGVGGPIETIGETAVARAIALAMSSKFGVGGSAFRTVEDREIYTDTVAFPGYTRTILDRAGPFNEELVRNQDDEYNFRIRKMGGRILLSPTIRSRYYSRSTLRSLWRQYYQYGYWKVRVLQLHPKQMSIRQFVPFAFVVSLITLAILGVLTNFGWLLLLAVAALYLAANILAALTTVKRKFVLIPALSFSYLILHISYGLGSLVGMVAFSGNWIPWLRSKR